MAERLDIEDFSRENEPDLCQYTYAFCKSGSTFSLTMKYWREHDFQSLSECESLRYVLLPNVTHYFNSFDDQSSHV